MTELDRRPTTGEVVTELAFHQHMAIRHTDEADRHELLSIEEYIAAGEHLLEVKERMGHGEFQAWLRDAYRRSPQQARRYMRVARLKDELPKRSQTSVLSLRRALRELADPKDESKSSGAGQQVITIDGEVVEVEHELAIALKDGSTIPIDEAPDLIARLEEEQHVKASPKKVKVKLPSGKEVTKEEAERHFRDLSRQHETVKAKLDSINHEYLDYIAELQDQLGKKAIPPIQGLPGDELKRAIERAHSRRSSDARQLVWDQIELLSRMSTYKQWEVAKAITEARDPEVVLEQLTQCHEYLGGVVSEVEKLTTKAGPRVLSADGR